MKYGRTTWFPLSLTLLSSALFGVACAAGPTESTSDPATSAPDLATDGSAPATPELGDGSADSPLARFDGGPPAHATEDAATNAQSAVIGDSGASHDAGATLDAGSSSQPRTADAGAPLVTPPPSTAIPPSASTAAPASASTTPPPSSDSSSPAGTAGAGPVSVPEPSVDAGRAPSAGLDAGATAPDASAPDDAANATPPTPPEPPAPSPPAPPVATPPTTCEAARDCTQTICFPIGVAACCRFDGSCGCTWAAGAYCL